MPQQHVVKILSIEKLTHDVLRIVVEKPKKFTFHCGQATDLSINVAGWEEIKAPFTFTSLPENDFLEFIIKTYPLHKNITFHLLQLTNLDELILHEVYGAIAYEGEGVFIAGGAGITPFISILRNLKCQNIIGNNQLIFANRTTADIILKEELLILLGKNFINILSEEKTQQYAFGRIEDAFLKSTIASSSKIFYLCGPLEMVAILERKIYHLGFEDVKIVKERF